MAELRTLDVLARWLSGGTPDRAKQEYWGGDIPWISGATMKTFDITTSDQHVSLEGARAGSQIAPAGAVLILVRGMAVHKEVRVGVAVNEVAFNQDVKALVPSREVAPRFLAYAIAARPADVLRLVTSAGSGTGVIETPSLRRLEVWVPTRAEQGQIVAVLDDATAAVAALDRLIAKKEAMKQGVMQELLAGRTRLPGFEERWGTATLGKCIAGLEAGVSVRSDPLRMTGPYVLKTSALSGGTLVEAELKSILAADVARARCSVLGDSMLVSRMNTPALVGEVAYVAHDRPDIYLPDRVWQVRRKAGTSLDMRWLTFMLSTGHGAARVRGLATGTSGSMKNIPKSAFLGLELEMPGLHEQKAIADVLADANTELLELRARLEKAKAVTQGMLQELMTGRTRLPLPRPAEATGADDTEVQAA